MSQTIRTFIALPLPKTIISGISDIQNQLKAHGFPVRWVRPESIHLTLKFLGETPIHAIDTIAVAMENSMKECIPMRLYTKGLGVFPGIKKPRIIWIGLSGDLKALSDMQAELESNLEKIGFPKEKRLFKGHLTIGRIKGNIHPGNLLDVLRSFSHFASEPFITGEVVLYQSELKPSGAIYSKLKTAFPPSGSR